MSITRRFGEWNEYFMRMALNAVTISKDPSTKTGAVIVKNRDVLSTGYNGFPSKVDDLDEWLEDKSIKYAFTIHAETNAVLRADRRDLDGAFIYCTHYPCADCAKVIIQVGITKVFYHDRKTLEEGNWADHYKYTDMMFENAGIYTKQVDVPL